jgi:hypothetical protein
MLYDRPKRSKLRRRNGAARNAGNNDLSRVVRFLTTKVVGINTRLLLDGRIKSLGTPKFALDTLALQGYAFYIERHGKKPWIQEGLTAQYL